MCRTTLSFKQLNDYLRLLLHANLLEEKNEGRITLKITEKERSLLKAYKKLKHLLKEESKFSCTEHAYTLREHFHREKA